MKRLADKVALITGATGGIGEATAARFLAEGARVMAVGRSAEKLEELTGRLDGGSSLATFVSEACDEDSVREATAETVRRFGGLDICFANAGTEGQTAPLDTMSIEEFRSVLETNVVGVWLSMKYAVPAMRERGGGSIIVTGSIASRIGFPMLSHYIASKHAVNGLVKTAALELGADRIRVNGVGPGPVDNRMMDSIGQQLGGGDSAAFQEQISATVPLGRYASNEEIANVVLFLASDEASYVTGSMYLIDGGFTAA
ncbi:MAG: SDR family NAD(P)-dependent oxidoreductase [Xanthomonadales bacterium]|nr:SDR family NAD(P)-dependent oxidoreductase [Xanthomonadales bacterium]